MHWWVAGSMLQLARACLPACPTRNPCCGPGRALLLNRLFAGVFGPGHCVLLLALTFAMPNATQRYQASAIRAPLLFMTQEHDEAEGNERVPHAPAPPDPTPPSRCVR